MPRMVAVLPVPGGPWMRLTPRPQSAARMAASCDGLYRLSMALSSAAGGCSDCGAADSLAALPGESSAGARRGSGLIAAAARAAAVLREQSMFEVQVADNHSLLVTD